MILRKTLRCHSSHPMQQAARVSNKTAFHLGDLVEYGDTEELFIKPIDPRTRVILGKDWIRMAEKHIMSAFDEDIEKIQSTLMKMGGLVEKSLFDAASALVKSDIELASKVREHDQVIGFTGGKVNIQTVRLIALAPLLRIFVCSPLLKWRQI